MVKQPSRIFFDFAP